MKITKRIVAAGTAGLLSATGLGLVVLGAPAATAATATAESGVGTRLQALKDALAGLVTDGTITQAQADRVATTLESSDALRGHGGRGGPGRVLGFDAAAEVLGMTTEELRTALAADGATLAGIAESRDVERQELVDALVAAGKERLAQAVTDGKLTQAEADERAAGLTERITAMVDQELPARGPGRGGRGGDEPAPAPSASTAPSSGTNSSGATSSSTT
ncbi:hypothetical protein NUM3379_27620 [Kineococcus sp. NUM-3379]